MSKIFFVLGKSCSGKDTIFQSLKENKQLNLKTVVGYTTVFKFNCLFSFKLWKINN